jgi:hypothetical protein
MTVAMEHRAARKVSAREIGCFLLLFVVLLAPALINAFCLVMEDSIAYSGQGPHWMRGKSAAVLVALPYRLAGYWALPLINCAMNAAAWILLLRIFSIRPNPFLVLLLACVSLQPLYASAVLVDAWFFPAVVLLISAGRLPPVFVGALTGWCLPLWWLPLSPLDSTFFWTPPTPRTSRVWPRRFRRRVPFPSSLNDWRARPNGQVTR